MSYKFSSSVLRILVYAVLVILLVITLAPIWILLVNATRSTVQIQQGLSFVPSTHMFENYGILLGRGLNLPRGFINSTFVAISVTVVSVYFSLLTAYAIVVYNFPGRSCSTVSFWCWSCSPCNCRSWGSISICRGWG